MLLLVWACGSEKPDSAIVIIYDNDVHCAVDGYSRFSAVAAMAALETPYVTKVSCGDFIQGDIIGSATQGMAVVDIMNLVGYDVVTLGNHEFDYGVPRMVELMDSLDASVVCANFRDLSDGKPCFEPFHIIKYGDVKIAYLGVTTTTTATNTSPQTFRDSEGKLQYDFSLQNFFTHIQSCVNRARARGADYVIALSHLGDLVYGEHPTSLDLIEQTYGIDVVLDGHAHSVISDTGVINAVGDTILLASSGTKFQNIGKLTLSTEGKFFSELIPTEMGTLPVDNKIYFFVEELMESIVKQGERVVGRSKVNLPYVDANDAKLSYLSQTSIGDFCADAYRVVLGTDVAVVNAGGIRASIEKGELTFNDLYSVFPFNNIACTAKIAGAELLDAMEFAVSSLPEGDGNFMQVSGMRFDVDCSIPSPAIMGIDGLYAYVGDGTRRVTNLQIFDSQRELYEDVVLEKEYTIASYSYLLKDLGAAGIFRQADILCEDCGHDVDILATYLENYLNGEIPVKYSMPSNRINVITTR